MLRLAEEMTSQSFLASVEGAVGTDSHPGPVLDSGNFRKSHAVLRRVRWSSWPNGKVWTYAPIYLRTGSLAERFETGKVRDASIGYNLEHTPLRSLTFAKINKTVDRLPSPFKHCL